jgi:type IV pilus assembly protein PilX
MTRSLPMRRSQEGVVLFIALIILVAMSLAGVALMRRVDTANIIAANLAFRQSSMHAGDMGVEVGRTWLMSISTANQSQLYNNSPAITGGNAYFADWASGVDLIGNTTTTADDFNWNGANVVTVTSPAPPTGYTVKYVIHRLCVGSGDPGSVTCIKNTGSAAGQSGSTKGAATFGTYAISVPIIASYRITVRVAGPRNSISYIQAVIS